MNIFISHADTDRELANALKRWIESSFPGSHGFVASHQADIPPGSIWKQEIKHSLEEADAVIILITERTLARKWTWFEVGASWMANRKIIPLCFENVNFDEIGTLLNDYQEIRWDSPEGADGLIKYLSKICSKYQGPTPESLFLLSSGKPDVILMTCYWSSSRGDIHRSYTRHGSLKGL